MTPACWVLVSVSPRGAPRRHVPWSQTPCALGAFRGSPAVASLAPAELIAVHGGVGRGTDSLSCLSGVLAVGLNPSAGVVGPAERG